MGVSCALSSDECLIDPSNAELEKSHSTHQLIFRTDGEELHLLAGHSLGKFTCEQYSRVFAACESCVSVVDRFFRECVENKCQRRLIAE